MTGWTYRGLLGGLAGWGTGVGRRRAEARLSYSVCTKLAVSHPCNVASPPDSMTCGLSCTPPVLAWGSECQLCIQEEEPGVAAVRSFSSHTSFSPHTILIAAFSQMGKLRLRRASDLSQGTYAAFHLRV